MANPSSILVWSIPLGQRSLVGYSPWGHRESDTTEWLSTHTTNFVLVVSWSGPSCHSQPKLWCHMVLAWGLGDAASESFSEAVEIHDPRAEWKNPGLKPGLSLLKPFLADPGVCFPCRLHMCASLWVLPHLGTHRVKFSGDILSIRDHLILCFYFC